MEKWKSEIRHYPAPFAELEVPGQVIFSIQSDVVRDMEDPEPILKHYEKIMHDVNYFSGFDSNERYRTERVAMDKQISGGKNESVITATKIWYFK